MTKAYLMNNLIEKMQSPDQDHRYMGLTDLMSEIKQDSSNFYGDEAVEYKVLQHVLKLVEDKISEVKNQAVKCLGVLIKIVRENQMEYIVQKLIDFSGSKDEELRDIAGLALKTITAELPQDSMLAPTACANLTPKLLAHVQNPSTPPETLIETLSILSILISRFPAYLSSPDLSPQPIPILTPLLSHPRPAVRKRTILTLAQFLPTAPQPLFDQLLNDTIVPGLKAGAGDAGLENQRTTVQLVAAVVRHSPGRIAGALRAIIPGVLEAANKEDDELREYALQALEVFVLRCPTEVTPFLNDIIQTGTRLIKYDPNYADGGDEDEEMDDAEDEDDEEDDLGDAYSDDEDTSYKIRRSATKLLCALIETRPELLTTFYKEVAPVLVQRFSDREQTVRLEVWATYGALLTQTKLYGGGNSARAGTPDRKRKRTSSGASTSEGMDVESNPESPITLARNQVPQLAKELLAQLRSPKTPTAVLQAGFTLLSQLIDVLPGCLSAHVAPLSTITQRVLSTSSNSSSVPLHTTYLGFLTAFFSSHAPSTFSGSLTNLTPALLRALSERHPRVAAEAFRVFSALLNALPPVKVGPGSEWADKVYDECVLRLKSADTDAEVRARAETCMGDLWVCATEVVRTKDGREWDAMCRTTGRVDGAVKVVTRVATEVDVGDQWISGSIEWVLGVLRKSGKAGKGEAFECLDTLLYKYKAGVPDQLVSTIVEQMKPYISTQDISLLANALSILACLMTLSPPQTYPAVEAEYLSEIYSVAYSPLLTGGSLDALLLFFAALVEADAEIATHVIPNLVIPAQKANKGEASYVNVAKCIGTVVKCHPSLAAGTIAEFSKSLKKGSKAPSSQQVVLSLLVLGEIGRIIDFAPQKDLFHASIELFSSTDEEIRSAAAFAAGNIAIGNLHLFLPAIVKIVQTDKDKRLLALHALKEVVSKCPELKLESVAETIWVPLFQDSENSEESTRNVAAGCLGKLTTTNPSRYLPQLQARIRDPDSSVRATVVAAIRYTFADSHHSYDELLSALIPDFLSLIEDQDLTVRRLAISALNSAARNKPQLIRDHLTVLLPQLYKETIINTDLIKTVQMGPWQHKVDEGLDARKTAYETMYTLLDTCLSRLDLHEFLVRVIAGLSDDSDEVKVLAYMMLYRLAGVASTALAQRLDEITPPLKKTMETKPGKDTVKQDIERIDELQHSALRAIAALRRAISPGVSVQFDSFVDTIPRSKWTAEFKELLSGS